MTLSIQCIGITCVHHQATIKIIYRVVLHSFPGHVMVLHFWDSLGKWTWDKKAKICEIHKRFQVISQVTKYVKPPCKILHLIELLFLTAWMDWRHLGEDIPRRLEERLARLNAKFYPSSVAAINCTGSSNYPSDLVRAMMDSDYLSFSRTSIGILRGWKSHEFRVLFPIHEI